jgi:hypothetical protein
MAQKLDAIKSVSDIITITCIKSFRRTIIGKRSTVRRMLPDPKVDRTPQHIVQISSAGQCTTTPKLTLIFRRIR